MPTDLETDLRRVFALTAELAPDASPDWPPLTLVTQTGPRSKRSSTITVLTGAVAAAGLIGVFSIGSLRSADETGVIPSVQPEPTLRPSLHPELIDAYPILRWNGPETIYGSFSYHSDDQGWGGTVGIVDASGTPITAIKISVFPPGYSTFPDATPGRIDGVGETAVGGNFVTLTWAMDGRPLTMVGDNLDLMYELIGHIEPERVTPSTRGYALRGDLPGGLVELAVPQHRVAMRNPTIATDDGQSNRFDISVQDAPLIESLVGGELAGLESVTINGFHGYTSTHPGSYGTHRVLALAISTDETLLVSSETMSFAELQAVAEQIELADEATFAATYALGSTSAVLLDNGDVSISD